MSDSISALLTRHLPDCFGEIDPARRRAAIDRYQPIAPPEELGNVGRVRWASGRSGHAPSYAGTDFIIARDRRIAAVYRFYDKLP